MGANKKCVVLALSLALFGLLASTYWSYNWSPQSQPQVTSSKSNPKPKSHQSHSKGRGVTQKTSSPKNKTFNQRLKQFRQETCGQVCQTSVKHEANFSPSDHPKLPEVKKLTKSFDCNRLWSDKFVDAPGGHKSAPKNIPANLKGGFRSGFIFEH